MSDERPLALIRGGGDLGTGVALRLHRAGWRVVIIELAQPLVIRRTVAFASAVFDGSIEVEGTVGRSVSPDQLAASWADGEIPVIVDPDRTRTAQLDPLAVIDAIMAKFNTGTRIGDAPIVVALGPGFTAGVDCHAVVETQRGHHLGRVYYRGAAQPDSGTPGSVGGQDAQRVVRAPVDGIFYAQRKIGDRLTAGEPIGRLVAVDGSPAASAAGRPAAIDPAPSLPGIVVKTSIAGILRGVLRDGLRIAARTKIADVDPRGAAEYCFTVSDKSWAVGGGALEAVLYLMQRL
jgi:xanthine dehydrogenase accessory factor